MSTEEQKVETVDEPTVVEVTPEAPVAVPAPVAPAPVAAAGLHLAHSSDTHPLVQAAIESGPLDATTLRELMNLQRDWESGEAKKEYTRAMVDMKRELPTVLNRDKVVDFASKGGRTTYTHTSLAAAVEAVTPPMCNHGFSASFKTSVGERNHVEVTCTLTHRDGHSESCALSGPPETSGTKNPVQAVASTVTLLERYTLLALLGIATKDHADPQPATSQPPKTVEEIIALYESARVPTDVAKTTKEWVAIKGILNEQDEEHLTIAREEAIARIKGGQS